MLPLKDYLIEATDETPQVKLLTNGELLIKGVSIPTNVAKFYNPIVEWIIAFKETNPTTVKLIFEIEYINTSSTRLILEIIKKIQSFSELNIPVTIVWRYIEEDEDNFDLGKDLQYSSKAEMEFEVIE